VQDYNVTVRSFPNNLTAMILGPTMRTREVRPLWVGLTVGLLVVGAATYLFTYLMIEDILALLK
jgi:hypothetical protein